MTDTGISGICLTTVIPVVTSTTTSPSIHVSCHNPYNISGSNDSLCFLHLFAKSSLSVLVQSREACLFANPNSKSQEHSAREYALAILDVGSYAILQVSISSGSRFVEILGPRFQSILSWHLVSWIGSRTKSNLIQDQLRFGPGVKIHVLRLPENFRLLRSLEPDPSHNSL